MITIFREKFYFSLRKEKIRLENTEYGISSLSWFKGYTVWFGDVIRMDRELKPNYLAPAQFSDEKRKAGVESESKLGKGAKWESLVWFLVCGVEEHAGAAEHRRQRYPFPVDVYPTRDLIELLMVHRCNCNLYLSNLIRFSLLSSSLLFFELCFCVWVELSWDGKGEIAGLGWVWVIVVYCWLPSSFNLTQLMSVSVF